MGELNCQANIGKIQRVLGWFQNLVENIALFKEH